MRRGAGTPGLSQENAGTRPAAPRRRAEALHTRNNIKPGLGQAREGSSCPCRDTHDIRLPWRPDRRHIEVSTTHSIVLRVHLLEVLPRDRECANCILLHLSLSGSVYAVQQFGRRCQTPGRWTKGYLPRYLLGMRGRADGRVESLRGTWRSFHLLRGMGRPTGRSMPGKKNKLRNWPSRWRPEKPLRKTEQNEWDMSGVGLFVDTRPP